MALLVPTYYSPGWQCHQISPFHSSTLPSAKCQVKLPIWHHTSQGQLLSVCLASWCLRNIVIYSLTVQAPSKLQIWDFSFLSTKSLPHKNLEMPFYRHLEFWIFFFHFVKMWCRQTSKPKTPTQAENYLGPTIWFWRRLNHSYSACHIWEPRVWNIFSVNVSDDGSDDPLPVLRGPDIKGAWTWRLINMD